MERCDHVQAPTRRPVHAQKKKRRRADPFSTSSLLLPITALMLPEAAFYGAAPTARPVRAAAAGRRASLREPTASDGKRKGKGRGVLGVLGAALSLQARPRRSALSHTLPSLSFSP